MFKQLAALVGQGSAFPYALGDPHPGGEWAGWTHHAGTARDDGAAVSVWRLTAGAGDPRLEAARHGVRKLKTVRHPNILAFKDATELEEGGGRVTLLLVTEAATPLLPSLAAAGGGAHAAECACIGLHAVAKAVAFLNNDCKMIHGNVCHATVVVTPSLDWKLGCLDLLTDVASFDAAAASPHAPRPPLDAAPRLAPRHYLPAEAARADHAALAASPPWAVDAWGLGCLAAEAFSGRPLGGVEDLRARLPALPPALAKPYQGLLASAPSKRLNPAKLAASDALHTPAVRALAFLDSLSVRDAAEKDAFFKATLPAALPRFPPAVAQRRLLPALGTALEYGGAPAAALATVVSVASGLDDAAFADRAAPLLARLLKSPDPGVRRAAFEALPAVAGRLPAALVEAAAWPAVEAAYADANPYLRELALRATLPLAPRLPPKTLAGPLLKHLAKLQVDDAGGVRANTTALLGNVAPLLGDAACRRVLTNAFARALRDPFPPARAAGAAAMGATLDRVGAEEVAGRGLPALAPACADPDRRVRAAALEAAAGAMRVLAANAAKLDAADEARERGEAAAGSAGGGGGGGAASGGGGGDASSWGWAAASALGRAAGAAAGAAAGVVAAAPANGGAGAPPPARPPPPPAPDARPPPPPAHATNNGWSDDDDDDGAAAAEAAARARLAGGGGGGAPRAPPPPPPADGSDSDWDQDIVRHAAPPTAGPGRGRGRGGLGAAARGGRGGLKLGGRGRGVNAADYL